MTDDASGATGAKPGDAGATGGSPPRSPLPSGPLQGTGIVDPLRVEPAAGPGAVTSNEHRSWLARSLGIYIIVLVGVLVHLLVAIWPDPVVSSDVVATLEREEQARAARSSQLENDARERFATAPTDSTSARSWRRDSSRAVQELADAKRLAQLTRQLADSVRQRRARAILDRVDVRLFWGWVTIPGLSLDLRLILLAMIAGGLGAFVHGAQSYATFVGNRTFSRSWSWWYILRPMIGAALAAIFYFAVRGALFPNSMTAVGDISPFGIAAIGSLTGMFSKQAVDKLHELFQNLFRTEAQSASTRSGTDPNPRPPRAETPSQPTTPTAGASTSDQGAATEGGAGGAGS